MSELMYKTLGNVSPERMPKVYFCCHPKDFDKFFGTVSDDILIKQRNNNGKCSIWYNGKPDGIYDEDFFERLRRMNLFVIPVTSEFLTTENCAFDVEYKFAAENNIPILPLMQEAGLEELFNKKCGDRQFLDKNAADPTAIGYDEKLSKYLASVLIGDELAEKIREAFDAYVFLSYRKKDRKYAQELMRLIHKNDFCRDIAIWYDEFLVPGEDFNGLIRKALEKSKLFVLTVTPSVIEKAVDADGEQHENYIVEHEYPMALESGKTVLPAELVPTDKDVLTQKYKDIPPCTDAYDDNQLSKALTEALSDIALRQNDNDPQHNFFIGLAYLSGTDVETDHERALELIQSAAESGLDEAIKKLVYMYRNGEGVKRDYHTAVMWQKKLAEEKEKTYKKYGSAVFAHGWFACLWELGDHLYEIRDIKGAKEVFLKMHKACSELEKESPSVILYSYLCSACSGLGKIYIAEGNTAKAKEYYFDGLDIARRLLKILEDEKTLFRIIINYEALGDIFRAECAYSKAEEYYKKALNTAIRRYEKYKKTDMYTAVSVCYNKLGIIAELEGNILKSREYCLKFLEGATGNYAENGTNISAGALEAAYNRLGDTYIAENNVSKAKECYQKAHAISKEIAEKVESIDARISLSISCTKLGDAARKEKDYSKAKEYYMMSVNLGEQLVAETQTVECKRELSVSYERMGSALTEEKSFSEAPEYLLKAIELRKSVAEITGTADSRRDLAIIYNNTGVLYSSMKKRREAREYYLMALEIYEALSEEKSTLQALDDVAHTYYNLALTYRLFKRFSYSMKAIEIWTEVLTRNPDYPILEEMREKIKRIAQM